MQSNFSPAALITGGARRIGAVIAANLHAQNWNVIIHYRHSEKDAFALCDALNKKRPASAFAAQGDFACFSDILRVIEAAGNQWQRLDCLINNASDFFKTPISDTTEEAWNNLMDSNLKAPYFLSQQAAPYLKKNQGVIINIADIHGIKPLPEYGVYSIAKAGLIMLTKVLAKELAPEIRVNAIAPGPTLSPEGNNVLTPALQQKLVEKTLLNRLSTPQEIVQTISFLLNTPSITGQIIQLDGGRLL